MFKSPYDLRAVKTAWSAGGVICAVRAKLQDTFNLKKKLTSKCVSGVLKRGASSEINVGVVYFCVDCLSAFTESPLYCMQTSKPGLLSHIRSSKHNMDRTVEYKLEYDVQLKWNEEKKSFQCDPMDSRKLKKAGYASLRQKLFSEFGFEFELDEISLE